MIRWIVAALMAVPVCAGDNRISSPSGKLFSHYTECSIEHPCIPEVVITRQNGEEVRRFEVRDKDGPCASILNLQWANEDTIGVECHGNPSMSLYDEVDITSGKVLRQYTGYSFVRSPDYAKVAHVGWIVHFAPPWVQSEYLQVGSITVYPLPPGMKPTDPKLLKKAPEVVQKRGLVYAGVHNFHSDFVWSANSRQIGLVDCLVDYRLRDDSEEAFNEGGTRENLRCFATAVGLDGSVRRKHIPFLPDKTFTLKWADERTLSLEYGGRLFKVQAQKPR